MAVLETIRNKFGILITVLIAVALLSFIVDPSSLLSVMNPGQANNEDITVSSINGHKVSYNDFNNQVQLLSNENVDRNVVRSQVLMNFVNEYLYSANAKAAGFNVSDKELAEILSGNIPSQLVDQIFGPGMTKSKLAEIEKNIANDASGRGKIEWNNILNMVRADRYLQKYNQYMLKSSFENSLVAEDNIKNSNNVFDIEFVNIPFVDVVDETIVVTDEEVAEYYKTHKNRYKTLADTRNIDYILVELDEDNYELQATKVDSVFAQIKNAEDFEKAAIENEFFKESAVLTMGSNTLESVANTENVTKWAFKESKPGVVSTTFNFSDEEKSYMAIALLTGANDTGYFPLEGEVVADIKAILSREKAADKKLAEVTEAVNGLNDLKDIAKALGATVSTKKNMTFASADLDMKLTGAASVAEVGVVNAPFKGMNGIYVYKVTNRSEGSYYTEDDANQKKNMIDTYYMLRYNYYVNQMAMYQVEDPGLVKDHSYLYF